jgi:hypothetical protein
MGRWLMRLGTDARGVGSRHYVGGNGDTRRVPIRPRHLPVDGGRYARPFGGWRGVTQRRTLRAQHWAKLWNAIGVRGSASRLWSPPAEPVAFMGRETRCARARGLTGRSARQVAFHRVDSDRVAFRLRRL